MPAAMVAHKSGKNSNAFRFPETKPHRSGFQIGQRPESVVLLFKKPIRAIKRLGKPCQRHGAKLREGHYGFILPVLRPARKKPAALAGGW